MLGNSREISYKLSLLHTHSWDFMDNGYMLYYKRHILIANCPITSYEIEAYWLIRGTCPCGEGGLVTFSMHPN